MTRLEQVPDVVSLRTNICSYFFLIFPFQLSLPGRRIMVIECGEEEVMPR